MKPFIGRNHDHWQLRNDLKRLLLECRAKESSRYAINGIHVEEGKLAATDGRRLVEIEVKHKIESGNYFCTTDGYLLTFIDGKFPDYKKIIPSKGTLRKIVKVSGEGSMLIGLVLGELCRAGCICQLSLYDQPAKILSKMISGRVSVYVARKKPAEKPFIIEAETTIGNIRYIQMPVSTKNELKEQPK